MWRLIISKALCTDTRLVPALSLLVGSHRPHFTPEDFRRWNKHNVLRRMKSVVPVKRPWCVVEDISPHICAHFLPPLLCAHVAPLPSHSHFHTKIWEEKNCTLHEYIYQSWSVGKIASVKSSPIYPPPQSSLPNLPFMTLNFLCIEWTDIIQSDIFGVLIKFSSYSKNRQFSLLRLPSPLSVTKIWKSSRSSIFWCHNFQIFEGFSNLQQTKKKHNLLNFWIFWMSEFLHCKLWNTLAKTNKNWFFFFLIILSCQAPSHPTHFFWKWVRLTFVLIPWWVCFCRFWSIVLQVPAALFNRQYEIRSSILI